MCESTKIGPYKVLWNVEEELNLKGISQLIKSEKGIPGRGNNSDRGTNAWHGVMNLGPAVERSLSLICKDCGAFASFFKTPACMRCLLSGYTISDMSNLCYLLIPGQYLFFVEHFGSWL